MTLPHTEETLLVHPEVEDLDLTQVLRALAEPVRLEIVRTIAEDPGGERQCGSFVLELECSKQNLSHHFRVLREAGVTRTREDGRNRFTSLRRTDLERRFPGLLDSVLNARSPSRRASGGSA